MIPQVPSCALSIRGPTLPQSSLLLCSAVSSTHLPSISHVSLRDAAARSVPELDVADGGPCKCLCAASLYARRAMITHTTQVTRPAERGVSGREGGGVSTCACCTARANQSSSCTSGACPEHRQAATTMQKWQWMVDGDANTLEGQPWRAADQRLCNSPGSTVNYRHDTPGAVMRSEH